MSATTTAAMPVAEGDTILLDFWLAGKAARIFQAAASGLAPPADCSVSEWAEASIVLSHRVSPRPGKLRLEPYQRLPLDWLKDNERVVLIWAAQIGKTIILQCFIGWAIDQYPGPAMVSISEGSRVRSLPFVVASFFSVPATSARKGENWYRRSPFLPRNRCNVTISTGNWNRLMSTV